MITASERIENDVVDVAVAPIFIWLERFDDWMLRGLEVFGRVLVLRAVTTTDVPTHQAKAQMHPGIANSQTVFAPGRARRYRPDLV